MAKQTDRQIDRTGGGYLQSPFGAGKKVFQPLSVELVKIHNKGAQNCKSANVHIKKSLFLKSLEMKLFLMHLNICCSSTIFGHLLRVRSNAIEMTLQSSLFRLDYIIIIFISCPPRVVLKRARPKVLNLQNFVSVKA